MERATNPFIIEDDKDDDDIDFDDLQPSFMVRMAPHVPSDVGAISEDSQPSVEHRDEGERTGDEEEEEEEETVHVGTLELPRRLYDRLFEYQREGVAWLWDLHNRVPHGGVLGDDMGLGKTVQVSAFLSALFRAHAACTVLIVAPLSVVAQWQRELRTWTGGTACVCQFHGGSARERAAALDAVHYGDGSSRGNSSSTGRVLVTTYGMVQSQAEALAPPGFVWDYVVLDEAHTIKNSATKIAQRVRLLRSTRRLLLTGTPITNNLQELWALMDYACAGALLGTHSAFRAEFEGPIIAGTDRHAGPYERELGERIAEKLRERIRPHFFRREKKDVFGSDSTAASSATPAAAAQAEALVQRAPEPEGVARITAHKNDLIVWVTLTALQRRLYETFLRSDQVAHVLNRSASPLAALGVLRKICNHPHVLREHATATSGAALDADLLAALRDTSPENSAKMRFLFALLDDLQTHRHRTLIFSQSTRVLDVIAMGMRQRSYKWLRVDGSTKDRNALIQQFNEFVVPFLPFHRFSCPVSHFSLSHVFHSIQ